MKKGILWILLGIICVSIVLGDTIEQEILVLFRHGTITMPAGKTRAYLNEIITLPEVLSVLNEIQVEEIYKAFPDFKSEDTLKIGPEGWVARLPDFSNLFVLKLPPSINRDSAILKLEELPCVIYAEKNQRGAPEYIPNDPHRDKQWGLGAIKAYDAFDLSRGSVSTKIGIIDDGVDDLHEDLKNKCMGDLGYYGEHGTHVAGIAAAKTDNGIGIVGIDWHARIWVEKILHWSIPELADAVISAANNGCKVINCSWGVNEYSPTLYSAFTYAYQMGALPVSSMSNTSNPHFYPKRFGPWMMNVGAIMRTGNPYRPYKVAPFSVVGYWIDVGAPGENIYSTLPENNYGYMDGTSMAALRSFWNCWPSFKCESKSKKL